MTEFDIINHFFGKTLHRSDVLHGIGDDAAIVKLLPGHELAITTDTLIAGRHFPENTSPFDIGYKSLAVNLSDLAAMGATPTWVNLALSLPSEDLDWLSHFSQGFFKLAKQHQIQLIGGDLTRGPLSITITAMGTLPANTAILRSQAKPADLIYVTGTLGDAGLALAFLEKKISLSASNAEAILKRLNRPEPQIACGQHLRGIATAAIDISDGLLADLGHILKQSSVGARINVNRVPLSPALQQLQPSTQAIELALTAGDDYELCFTVPPEKCAQLEAALLTLPCAYTCIGEIVTHQGMELFYQDGSNYHGSVKGYQHF